MNFCVCASDFVVISAAGSSRSTPFCGRKGSVSLLNIWECYKRRWRAVGKKKSAGKFQYWFYMFPPGFNPAQMYVGLASSKSELNPATNEMNE
jgi:hypothetical protein